MTKGVLLYNKGTKCLLRLFTAIYSLRKVYDGSIAVVLEGFHTPSTKDILNKLGVTNLVQIADTLEYPLVVKSHIDDYSPFDITLFLDADTIVMNNIDEIWDLIEQYGFVVPQFVDWKTEGRVMSGRIKSWKKVCTSEDIEGALKFGVAVNTGVFGFKKNDIFFKEWYQLTKKGYDAGVSKIPDELACQILLYRYLHMILGCEWNDSVKFRSGGEEFDTTKTKIIHFHGRKHCGDRETNHYWKQNYWQMVREHRFTETEVMSLFVPNGDRSFKNYIRKLWKIQKKITYVTAVNPAYLEKLKKNFPKWMITEGIMEHELIVFVKDIPITSTQLDFLRKVKGVQIIPWTFDSPTERENMLSAFVFGVARYVKTPFFVKIDADVKPKTWKFEITSEMLDCTLAGHKWGYTKVKGDNTQIHWLNVLDNWWKEKTGEEPIFPIITGRRYRHKRICSFIQIHDTEFTKHVAEMCGNRMPIPSQDTLMFYVALRMNKKIMYCNFKDVFQP